MFYAPSISAVHIFTSNFGQLPTKVELEKSREHSIEHGAVSINKIKEKRGFTSAMAVDQR